MTPNGEEDKVTNRQLYEALENRPSRRELRLTVLIGIIFAQFLAAAESPVDTKAQALISWILGLL